jgi:hypothetical protein
MKPKDEMVRDAIRPALDALHEDIGYAGGQAVVARYVGMELPTLRALINSPDRMPNLYHLVRFIEETGGGNLLNALARLAGKVVADVPAAGNADPAAIAGVLKETAEVIQRYSEAIKDGRVDAVDLHDVEKEVREAQSALAGLAAYIRRLYEEGTSWLKP